MDFLGFFSKTPKNTPRPRPQTQEQLIIKIWREFCDCTLKNSHDSLMLCRLNLCNLLKIIKASILKGDTKEVIDVFTKHQIIKQLISFAEADTPHGLVNEVIHFFTVLGNPPFATLLSQSFIIDPLNSFLETTQPYDSNLFFKLIRSLLSWVTNHPDDYRLFLVSDTSSPLIHHFSQMLVTNYTEMGHTLLQLLNASKSIPSLLNFIINYSPLVSTIIAIIDDCTNRREYESATIEFFECVDLSMKISPILFSSTFAASFHESVLQRWFNSNATLYLPNFIYILCTFDSSVLISAIVDHFSSQFSKLITSENERVVYLTLRCLTLLVEKSIAVFGEHQQTVAITVDYITLFDQQLFPMNVTNDEIAQARNRVLMNMSHIEMGQSKFEISNHLSELLFLLGKFDNNTPKVNAALSELFATIASLNCKESEFFIFDSSNTNGMFAKLTEVAAKWNNAESARAVTRIKEGHEGKPEYTSLLILIDLIKELHLIVKAKREMNELKS
ncbi:hypothetical protein GPJ56_005091 [Histomonas meleagridis]|uniref:uncharacterized protein n=1 Tax=Histomonas meleagridis TaxID=135588 RepID=UPI003559D857|nr:hypothetical protein GPJ56_005091 [Histomonas meleagridis]KAH0802608.1 hypothetical protein GO595_004657 [Histomonas meleagridis]